MPAFRFKLISFFIFLGYSTFSQVPCTGVPALNTLVLTSNPVCAGSTVTLSLLNQTNFANLVYVWAKTTSSISSSFVTFAITTISTQTITTNSPFWIRVGVTCQNGNQTTSTSAVYLSIATNSISLNSPTICSGQQTTLNAFSAGTINWYNSPTSTTSIGIGNSFVTPTLSAGNHTYYAEATNACTLVPFRYPAIITADTLIPNVTVNSGTICLGNTFFITPNGADTYTYSSFTNYVSPVASTVYTITGKFLSSVCTASATSTVIVEPGPSLTVTTVPGIICPGETASISANGALTYTWNNFLSGNFLIVSPSTNANYSITGVDGYGCFSNTVVTVNVNSCLELKALTSDEILLGVYPNPNQGHFTLLCSKYIDVKIFNAIGQLILKIYLLKGENIIEINDLQTGLYFIECIDSDQTKRIRMIKE